MKFSSAQNLREIIFSFFLFQQKYIPDEYFAYVKPYFDAILQNGYQAYTSILNKMTITSENQEEILENFSSEQNIVEDSPISNAPPLDDPQSTISS